MTSAYDELRNWLGTKFTAGPGDSMLIQGRMIQGRLDPQSGTNISGEQYAQELINQTLDRVRTWADSYARRYSKSIPYEYYQKAAMQELRNVIDTSRMLEPHWDEGYSEAYKVRMGTSRMMVDQPGQRTSPMAFSQYQSLYGYGVREKEGAREAINLQASMAATPGYVFDPATREWRVGREPAKLPKALQLQAQYHVGLEGGERIASPIRMAGAEAAETGYRLRAAVAWGGGSPSGQGYIQKGRFSPVGERQGSFLVSGREVENFQLPEPGQIARRGESLVLGTTGSYEHKLKVKSWEAGQLKDIWMSDQPERNDMYRVHYNVAWRGGAMALKDMGVKAVLQEADIGRMLSGGAADVMFDRPSDIRQFAYAALSGQSPSELRRLGANVPDRPDYHSLAFGEARATTWDIGNDKQMMRAFSRLVAENTRIEERTYPVHESMMAPYEASFRGGKEGMKYLRAITGSRTRRPNPLNVTGIEDMGEGIFNVTRRMPVTRFDILGSVSRAWEYGKTRLSAEEMARLGEEQPGLARRLWREGASTRLGFQQPLRGVLATYRGADPGKVTRFQDMPWQEIAGRAVELGGEGMPGSALIEAMGEYTKKGRLISMEMGGKTAYMPSPQTILQHSVLSPTGQEASALATRYGEVFQRALEAEAMYGLPGADQPAREAMFRYQKEAVRFSKQPGVQQNMQSTFLRRAREGVYTGFTGLKPGELFMGDESLRQFFGVEERQLQQLKDLLPFNNPDKALGMGWRRPTSAASQVGGMFSLVSQEEMIRRHPELEGVDLSNVMGMGGLEAGMQRGDFDADRFLAFLASSVTRGKEGNLRLQTGLELSKTFVKQNRVGQFLETFEKIAPGPFKQFGKLARRAFPTMKQTEFAKAFFPGVGSNEMVSWAKDLMEMNSPEEVMGWIQKQGAYRVGTKGLADIFTGQTMSKQMMGVTYNEWIRNMAGQLPPGARDRFAEIYQRPLDAKALPDPMLRMMEIQQTYNVAGGKEIDPETGKERYKHAGGFAEIYHPFKTDPKRGVGPQPGFVPAGLHGLAGEISRIATSRGEEGAQSVLPAEGWADIIMEEGMDREGLMKALESGKGMSEFVNRDWLMRGQAPLSKSLMSSIWRRGAKKEFTALGGLAAFAMAPESRQAQLAQMGEEKAAGIAMAKPKGGPLRRFTQNLALAQRSQFVTGGLRDIWGRVSGSLGLGGPASVVASSIAPEEAAIPAGFVANGEAMARGGAAVQAARGVQTRGPIEDAAQAEVNAQLRAEIARKQGTPQVQVDMAAAAEASESVLTSDLLARAQAERARFRGEEDLPDYMSGATIDWDKVQEIPYGPQAAPQGGLSGRIAAKKAAKTPLEEQLLGMGMPPEQARIMGELEQARVSARVTPATKPGEKDAPFHQADLSAAEARRAERAPVNVQGGAPPRGPTKPPVAEAQMGSGGPPMGPREHLVRMAQQALPTGDKMTGGWKWEEGQMTAWTRPDDPVKDFRRLVKKYTALSTGLEAAERGANIAKEMPALDLELEKYQPGLSRQLTALSRYHAGGKMGAGVVGAAMGVKEAVIKQYGELGRLGGIIHEEMPKGVTPEQMVQKVAAYEEQLRAGPQGKKVVGDDLEKMFTRLVESGEKFTTTMDKANQVMGETSSILSTESRDPYAKMAMLQRQGKLLGVAKGRIRLEAQELSELGPAPEGEVGAELTRRRAALKTTRARIEEQALAVREQQAELETPRRGRFTQDVGRIFGLAMLPWQMQFAKMWGAQQAEQAFQGAAAVDVGMGQAMFAGGMMPVGGLAGRQQELTARQGWAQYYMGQGAQRSTGMMQGLMAETPGLARGLGAAAPYGQYLGYGLAIELAMNQVAGRGFLTGSNPMLMGGSRAGTIGGLGLAAGIGVMGTQAVVDVVNATQDRSLTLKDVPREAWTTISRAAGIGVAGLVTGEIGKLEDWGLMSGPKADEWRQHLGRTLAGTPQAGLTPAEQRDQARRASPAYQRQQAIMDAMKAEGLSPEQAASYSQVYARMGILDPQRQAKMAAAAWPVEQAAGMGVGEMGQAGMGILQQLGYVPGAQPKMQEQLYTLMMNRARQAPGQFMAFQGGMMQAAGMVGEWPARLGMTGMGGLALTKQMGGMLAGGQTPWEVNKWMTENVTLSSPQAWSDKMREWGQPELAMLTPMGQPANQAISRQYEDVVRRQGREQQQFGFRMEREQIGMQRGWMTRQWGIEDQMRGLRNRYRVEDADFGLQSMQLRLEQAEIGKSQRQRSYELQDLRYQWGVQDVGIAGQRANVQYQWQMADISRSRQQYEQQFGWQKYDIAQSREQGNVQFGWQMEDIGEALRFASGRQRRQLLKQRERAYVQDTWRRRALEETERRGDVKYGWQQEEFGIAEERATTQKGWGDEDRARQLERMKKEYELTVALRKQDEEIQEKQLDLLRQQYETEQKRREELVNIIIPNEEKLEMLQREQATQGLAWREARLELDLQHFEEVTPLQDKLTASTRQMEDAWNKWQITMEKGIPAAMKLFMKEMGPESGPFKALEKWQEMLKEFERMGGSGGKGGSLGQAVESSIRRWLDGHMPEWSMR